MQAHLYLKNAVLFLLLLLIGSTELLADPTTPKNCDLDIAVQINRHASCGSNNGAACVEVTGASGGYVLNWGSELCYDNLAPGDYCVYVVDSAQCRDTVIFTINEEPCVDDCELAIRLMSKTDASCGSDGAACVEVTGASGGYVLNWGSELCYDNLAPGDYCVYVIDSAQCRDTVIFTINEEPCDTVCELSLRLVSKTDANCETMKGAACVEVTGAKGAYDLSWGSELCYDNLEPGDYCVYVTDSTQCRDSVLFSIKKANCPPLTCELTVESNITLLPSCEASDGAVSVEVTGQKGAVAVFWNGEPGSLTRNDLSAGTYKVVVQEIENNNCKDSVTVELATSSSVMVQLQADTVCQDENGAASYQISGCFEGPEVITVFDENGVLANINSLPVGTYTFVAADQNGNEINRQLFEIIAYPEFSVTPTTSARCDMDGFIRLSAEGGNDNYIFDWADISGIDDEANRSGLAGGDYTVTITNKQTGCRVTKSYTVIEGMAPDISLKDTNIFCRGDTVLLEVAGELSDDYQYQWFADNDLIVSEQDSLARFFCENCPSAQVWVEVSDSSNCQSVDTARLTFIDLKPVLSSDLSLEGNCNNTTIDFSNKNSSAQYYEWNFGDPANPDASSANPDTSYSYQSPGEYRVSLTLSKDVACSQIANRTYDTLITVAPPAGLLPSFSYELKEPCNIPTTLEFFNESTIKNGNIDSLVWFIDGERFINDKQPTIEVVRPDSASVRLEIYDGAGCEAAIEEDIFIDTVPVVIADNTVCQGDTVQLGSDDPNVVYIWEPNDYFSDTEGQPTIVLSESATFFAKIIRNGECELLEDNYLMRPPVSYQRTPSSSTCADMPIKIGVGNTSQAAISWTDENGNLLSTNDSLEVDAGTYFVKLSYENAPFCSVEDTVVVISRAIDIASDTAFSLCAPGQVSPMVINLNLEDTLTYDWLPKELLQAGTDQTGMPIFTISESTDLVVNLENQFGCKMTQQIPVVVTRLGITDTFNLVPTPDRIGAGEMSTLQLEPPLSSGYSVAWGEEPTLEVTSNTAIATPAESTTYTATITDELTQCSIPVSAVVNVGCLPDNLFIPNTFSPNGDNRNDVLYVRGIAGYTSMSLIIYNRWGQQVFETTDPDIGWDGTFKGEPANGDVFGYYLTVICPGEEIVKKGNITLLR